MAVHFIDDQTGEISDLVIDTGEDAPVSERRAYRESGQAVPAERERGRTPIWPVFVVFAAIAGFLIGGGVATAASQAEIHNLKVELGYPDVP